MLVNFKPNAKFKFVRVYFLSQKNRNDIDKIFDKMHEQDKLNYVIQLIPFNYFVFVVWRTFLGGKRKNRMAINIKALNKISQSNTYPLPLQSDIIVSVTKYQFITVVNAVGWFHQFNVKKNIYI